MRQDSSTRKRAPSNCGLPCRRLPPKRGGGSSWLFYFKSPQTAPGLYPEHDIFIQSMKLKNTLRWMHGEDLITHLSNEYYD
jgi:hypothetical protein